MQLGLKGTSAGCGLALRRRSGHNTLNALLDQLGWPFGFFGEGRPVRSGRMQPTGFASLRSARQRLMLALGGLF